MLEMLREGLNHHDRIPHPTGSLPLSSWVRHIVAHKPLRRWDEPPSEGRATDDRQGDRHGDRHGDRQGDR